MDELTRDVLMQNENAARELSYAAQELETANCRSIPLLRLFVRQAREVAHAAAGAIGELVAMENETGEGTPATEAAPKPRAPRAAGDEHRHKFNAAGVCEVVPKGASAPCGKVKSNRGPKPAADAPPPVDPRQTTHPATGINPAAADRFANGGQGSTSTQDRR